MNNKFDINTIDSSTFRFFYARYKSYILPFMVILICVLLFFELVIPQFSNFLQAKKNIALDKKKIAGLNINVNLLSGYNNSNLSSELSLTSLALPPQKDFISVLNALSGSANQSGVSLGDFQFSIGDLNATSVEAGSGIPSIEIDVSATGSSQNTTKFIADLYAVLPIAQIKKIDLSSGQAEVTVDFYYKPFFSSQIDPAKSLSVFSKSQLLLLDKLSSWRSTQNIQTSSSSAAYASGSGTIPSNPQPF